MLGNENSELEKLRHSLDSLSRVAGLGATISIASAQPNASLRQQIPEPFRSNALFLDLGSTDADMTGALEGIVDYHPVVLADAGCTFDIDLKEDLIKLLLSRKEELVLGPGMAAYANSAKSFHRGDKDSPWLKAP
ncbi:hypothetical protein ACVDG5_016195 [Mesorhizobium sp. ORM6]